MKILIAIVVILLMQVPLKAQRFDSLNVRLCETCSQTSMTGFSYADTLKDGKGNTIYLSSVVGLPFSHTVRSGNLQLESNYIYGCVVPTLVLPFYKGAYNDSVCKETKVAFRATSLKADTVVQLPMIDKLFWTASDTIVDKSDTADVLRVKFANNTTGTKPGLVTVYAKRGLYQTRKVDSINITVLNTKSPELVLNKLLSYDICPGTDIDFSRIPLVVTNKNDFNQGIEWDTLPSPYMYSRNGNQDTVWVRPPVSTTYLVTGWNSPCRTTQAIVVRVVKPSATLIAPDTTFIASEQEGKKQNIPISIRANGSFLHSCKPNTVRFDVSFNKSMFLPDWKDGEQQYTDIDSTRTVNVVTKVKSGAEIANDVDSVLYQMPGYVLLGNNDTTAITISNVQWFGEDYYEKRTDGQGQSRLDITQDTTVGVLRVTGCNITTPRFLSSGNSVVQIVSIMPNPAQSGSSVLIESTEAQKVRLEILNSLGQVSMSEDLELQKGAILHSLTSLEDYATGTYTLHLTCAKGTDSKMFIILK